MNDEQKVVFRQLQLSGIGIIVLVFGLIDQNKAYCIIGVGIILFGILRALLIHKLTKQGKNE